MRRCKSKAKRAEEQLAAAEAEKEAAKSRVRQLTLAQQEREAENTRLLRELEVNDYGVTTDMILSLTSYSLHRMLGRHTKGYERR